MIYLLIAGGIFVVDFVVKYLVEILAKEKERIPFAGDRMYLTKHHNKGAALNFGQARNDIVRFISLGLSAVCLLVFVFTLGQKGKRLLKLGLSFLLGGAFCNTYDRMVRGYVVDYVGFAVENKRFSNIIFNLSDFGIMIGAALSVLSIPPAEIAKERKKNAKEKAKAAKAAKAK
jgi:signal peptidase II